MHQSYLTCDFESNHNQNKNERRKNKKNSLNKFEKGLDCYIDYNEVKKIAKKICKKRRFFAYKQSQTFFCSWGSD